jgi:uncharacterized membrane protein
MSVHPSALLAIALMAIVTYATRAGGYWAMGRVTLSPRVAAMLACLPGAVLSALVVPAVLEEGIAGVVALAATAAAMRWRGNLLLAMAAGIVTIQLMRQVV